MYKELDKDLVNKIIFNYKRVIKELNEIESYTLAKSIVVENNMQFGICYFVFKKFDIKISSKDLFMKSVTNRYSGEYWFGTPIASHSTEKIIKCLQKRVDILKTFEEFDKNQNKLLWKTK